MKLSVINEYIDVCNDIIQIDCVPLVSLQCCLISRRGLDDCAVTVSCRPTVRMPANR